ncbi:MAG: hypothetical protein ACR2P8_03900 [Myxococcota bacterium]
MDDAAHTGGGEMEVTPEEARFLRRFFRRQFLPWAAALLVFSVASTVLLGGGDAVEVEARTSAAVAQLRSENQKLTAELEMISTRLEAGLARRESSAGNDLERRVEDAKRNVRMIEARIAARLERRLDSLEARGSAAPSQATMAPRTTGAGAPPPDASAWDVSQILDRLYAVEMAQQEGGGPSGTRLRALEERVARLEVGDAGSTLPAELAPPPAL